MPRPYRAEQLVRVLDSIAVRCAMPRLYEGAEQLPFPFPECPECCAMPRLYGAEQLIIVEAFVIDLVVQYPVILGAKQRVPQYLCCVPLCNAPSYWVLNNGLVLSTTASQKTSRIMWIEPHNPA